MKSMRRVSVTGTPRLIEYPKRMRYFALLVLALTACDCGDDHPMDAATGDTGMDAQRDVPGFDVGDRMCRAALPVDMIWVIDNSNSMAEEQASLAENFPVLIETLTTPPDADGDGFPDFEPITDLRIGIVTTDMGVGDNPGVIGCPPGNGDDGVFVSDARSGCGTSLGDPPWLQFDGDNATQFNDDFACLSELGTNGCGLEQQLEASLSAITTQAEPGAPNEGFLRGDSLVAIVYVTDEDDCSAADDSIFDPSADARTELGHFRTRCAFNDSFLHPISRYLNAFHALELDRNAPVIVAAITGVPRNLTPDPTDVDFAEVLADERMQFTLDPDDDTQLVPACEFGGVGSAPPARRIVEVVQDFGRTGNGFLASICQPDLRPVLQSIAELIARNICEAPI